MATFFMGYARSNGSASRAAAPPAEDQNSSAFTYSMLQEAHVVELTRPGVASSRARRAKAAPARLARSAVASSIASVS